MENLNAEVCEKCGCMYVVDKPHICHQENSYVPKLNLPRELAREISLKNTIALINSQEQRIKELAEENKKLMSTSSFQGAIIGNLQVAANELTADKERLEKLLDDKCDRCIERERADTVREMQERIHARQVSYGNITFRVVPIDDIDQIAKEMLEGEK